MNSRPLPSSALLSVVEGRSCMSRLYAILGAIGAVFAALFAAFTMGGRSTANKRDAQDARASLDTYRKSTEAQDEASDLSDDAVNDWLRNRARK